MQAEKTTDQHLTPICPILKSIEEGAIILLEFENLSSVIKFEDYHIHETRPGRSKINRHYSVFSQNYKLPDGRKVKKVVTSCIYGTHRLDFRWDPEFKIHLPQSFDRDIILELAYVLEDGTIYVNQRLIPKIFLDNRIVQEKVKSLTRPSYFHKVAAPFIAGLTTRFHVPRWKKNLFHRTDLVKLHAMYEKATGGLEHGSFVYVGCKEEVYLLCVAKGEDKKPYMQGTYLTSTKPIFYFSNNYLDFISRPDAEKPKFKGTKNDLCNAAIYRNYDIPGFNGEPFIFPQMGREQNCKNAIFIGEPELITGDLGEALIHFQTTDFAEFPDIVEEYASTSGFIHPSFERRYEYFF